MSQTKAQLLAGTSTQDIVADDVTVSSMNGGPIAGFRNLIINGNFDIDQRNNGASVNSGVGAPTYTLDRWIVTASTAAVTAIQGAQTSAPYNFLSITGGAGNTGVSIRQRIEARTIREFAGQQVTFSFHIYNASSNATSITVQMDRANAVDNFSTATQFSSTVLPSVSNTARQSITVTLPAEARNGVEVRFVANALTTGIFVLHTVQLEPGPVATPFERRPIGTELALCQRYFEIATNAWCGQAVANAGYLNLGVFKVTKRSAPTMTSIQQAGLGNGGFGARTAVSNTTAGFIINAVSTGTINGAGWEDSWAASAEL